MLLSVDVGNTSTVFGASEINREPVGISHQWRLSSSRERMPDEWFSLVSPLFSATGLEQRDFAGMIVSSVVPAVTRSLVEFGRRYLQLEPIVVSHALDLGISILADMPSEVGTDRLVNAAFAYHRFGGPAIIVDLGTATKLEAVTADGNYLGGVIAPGIGLTLDALASRAARLYSVELKVPAFAIGSNTVTAVQSGVVSGHVAMIEGMVERIRGELGGADHVVLTGGYSSSVADALTCVTAYEPDLTLSGLCFIYQRNCATTDSNL